MLHANLRGSLLFNRQMHPSIRLQSTQTKELKFSHQSNEIRISLSLCATLNSFIYVYRSNKNKYLFFSVTNKEALCHHHIYMPLYCSTNTKALIAALCIFTGCVLIFCIIVCIGRKKKIIIISVNWKKRENESNTQGSDYEDVVLSTSVNFTMNKKTTQVDGHYTELSPSNKDILQSNYASLSKDSQSYDGYEVAPSHE